MDYYDSIANGYNALHGEEQLRKLKIIKKCLPRNFPKNGLILDVGCGTGISKMLGNVVGIDPSKKLLIRSEFPVIQGIAEALPFSDRTFDAVISVTALHHCKDIKKAIVEIKRVAKGTVVLSILKKSKYYPLLESEIKKQFRVKGTIDDPIDSIFMCSKHSSCPFPTNIQ